jgi:2,3-bisphosphoglycerate-dependent phosphoglycerate mutase
VSRSEQSSWVLYLIRHAQSQNNAKPEPERVPDPEITSIGWGQSEKLAGELVRISPERFYCSPFLRTLQTARPVADRLGLTPIVRQDLFEQGGCYSGHKIGEREARPGMSRTQIEERFPGWTVDSEIGSKGWNRLPHYETIGEARQRATRVVSWYESQSVHASSRVAMMIHADFKMRLVEAFLGINDLDPHFEEPFNTSITCLVRKGGSWQLRLWNHHGHLSDELLTA